VVRHDGIGSAGGAASAWYDKNVAKYVVVSTGSDGGYSINTFTVENHTITMSPRTVANDAPTTSM
jgi:hypothetical protein